MPVVFSSSYRAPWWLPGGHAQTIFPTVFRRVPDLPFERTYLDLSDGDCIGLDWVYAKKKSRAVLLLSHGLEGDSRRKYIRGMCLAALELGMDCVARNFRCCGGTTNRLPGMYHSGQTLDIRDTVTFCLAQGYESVFLVGYSMGGNQTLKYLGEEGKAIAPQVRAAAVFSVPCDLPGAAKVLDLPKNSIYMRNFMRTLKEKVRRKHAAYPGLYPLDALDAMRTFAEFDAAYTAPVHGFLSAEDYWTKASSLPWLTKITVPTLVVNARNDPFLSSGCYPTALAKASAGVFLEMPEQGGHVGFTLARSGPYWSERRAIEFFRPYLPSA